MTVSILTLFLLHFWDTPRALRRGPQGTRGIPVPEGKPGSQVGKAATLMTFGEGSGEQSYRTALKRKWAGRLNKILY